MGTCYNTAVVNAPIEDVWAKIKDFHDLSWAEGVVEKVDTIGDTPGTVPGAKRILNDSFHETLLSVEDDSCSLCYSIDDGPGPVARGLVNNCIGVVRLAPVTDADGTFVEWSSSFKSDDTEAVTKFCDPIYQGLLQALKSSF